MRNYLYRLLQTWTGVPELEERVLALEALIEHKNASLDMREAERKTEAAALRRATDLVDQARLVHNQDQALIAEVSGQRWAAVSALVGGIELLQQKWLLRARDLENRNTFKEQAYRRATNELGELKHAVQKQFGVHPSQAKKSTAELGFGGTLRQLTTEPEPLDQLTSRSGGLARY